MSEVISMSHDAAEAAALLKRETEDLQSMLADLQGKTRDFNSSYKEEDYAYTVEVRKAAAAAATTTAAGSRGAGSSSAAHKRTAISSSSWAKSTVPRRTPGQQLTAQQADEAALRDYNAKHSKALIGARVSKKQLPHGAPSYDVAAAERHTKQSAAAVSFARASRTPAVPVVSPNAANANADGTSTRIVECDVKDSSTRKRHRHAVFGTEPRLGTTSTIPRASASDHGKTSSSSGGGSLQNTRSSKRQACSATSASSSASASDGGDGGFSKFMPAPQTEDQRRQRTIEQALARTRSLLGLSGKDDLPPPAPALTPTPEVDVEVEAESALLTRTQTQEPARVSEAQTPNGDPDELTMDVEVEVPEVAAGGPAAAEVEVETARANEGANEGAIEQESVPGGMESSQVVGERKGDSAAPAAASSPVVRKHQRAPAPNKPQYTGPGSFPKASRTNGSARSSRESDMAPHPVVERAAAAAAAAKAKAESPRNTDKRILHLVLGQRLGYDVSKADAAVKKGVLGVPVLKPAHAPTNKVSSAADNESGVGKSASDMTAAIMHPAPPESIVPVDKLAHHPRASSVVIRPLSNILKGKPEAAAVAAQRTMAGVTPGPGAYEVAAAKTKLDLRDVTNKSGKIYHHPVSKPAATQLHIFSKTKELLHTPGPGDYDVTRADKQAATSVPAAKITAVAPEKTIQQMRKQYWEDKAADLRLEHDGLKGATDDSLSSRRRVPSVKIAASEEQLLGQQDERTVRAHQRKQNMKEMEEEEAYHRDMLQIEHALETVEPRTRSGIDMAQQLRDKQSRQKQLHDKPSLQSAMAIKLRGDEAKNRTYGPALQVPWVLEGGGVREGDASSSSMAEERAESPIAQVRRMLQRKQDGLPAVENTKYADDTKAFLRSAVPRAQSLNMNARKHEPEAAVATVLAQRELLDRRAKGLDADFLGPQLQADTLAELQSKPGQAAKFDVMGKHGRDIVKVLGKGQVLVKAFNQHRTAAHEEDPHGPGEYDVEDAIDSTGKGNKAKGVAFSKLVAREDAIGPNGEAPISAQAAWADLLTGGDEGFDDDLLMQDMLDLEYGVSKDTYLDLKKAPQNIKLYQRERHEERDRKESQAKENPLNDHLGGSYFEEHTMTADAAKSNLQAFEKRPGRSTGGGDSKEDKLSEEDRLMNEILNDDYEMGYIGGKHSKPAHTEEGRALDLEVKNANPMMPREADAPVFDDPKARPRFKQKTKQKRPKIRDYLKDGTAFGDAENAENDEYNEHKQDAQEVEVEYDSYDSDNRPEYDTHRANSYLDKHTNIAVLMSQQPGREDPFGRDGAAGAGAGADDEKLVREIRRELGIDEYSAIPSEAQRKMESDLAISQGKHIDKGIEITSKNLRTKPLEMVNMDLQRGREDKGTSSYSGGGNGGEGSASRSEAALKAEADREARKDFNDFGNKANNMAAHWDKAVGRSDIDDDAKGVEGLIHDVTGLPANIVPTRSGGDRVLDLEVDRDVLKGKNKLAVVPNISKTLHEPRIGETEGHLNTDLHYGDPDPQAGKGKHGKGLAPMKGPGDKHDGPAMHNQSGRGAASKHDEEVLTKELGEFHDQKVSQGNVLDIDSHTAEMSTVKNLKGGSMPGVSGRPDVRQKGKKALKKQLSKRELDSLIQSALKEKERKSSKIAMAQTENGSGSVPVKRDTNTQTKQNAVKKALRSAASVDEKLKSIRFADNVDKVDREPAAVGQENSTSTKGSKILKGKGVAGEKAAGERESSKIKGESTTHPSKLQDTLLSIRTSQDYTHGDGLGMIASPQPLTPLHVNVPVHSAVSMGLKPEQHSSSAADGGNVGGGALAALDALEKKFAYLDVEE